MTGETFAALLAPNLQGVRKFVQTRLRAPDHADDIVQQTLLQAFSRRDQLRAEAKFKSWLWSIAMNEIRMFIRRGRTAVSLDAVPHFNFHDRGPSPLARFEQIETQDRLRAGMAKLSERDRTTIRLRDLDGKSLSETAAAIESSEAATKSTHFRARRRLACALRSNTGALTAGQ